MIPHGAQKDIRRKTKDPRHKNEVFLLKSVTKCAFSRIYLQFGNISSKKHVLKFLSLMPQVNTLDG